MKRTTIMLPDELATLVELERQRRDMSAAEVIRQALATYFEVDGTRPKPLPFIGIGASGCTDGGIERILSEEWERDLRRDAGLDRDR
jgi:hypothetical protein